MIDEYSVSIGIVVGSAIVGLYFYGRETGEARKDAEVARMNRARTQFDRYYADDGETEEPIAPPSLSELAAFPKRPA